MARLNDHYLKLEAGYLFPEIERRVASFVESHPDADLIRLGIGDVVLPLPPAVGEAMRRAVDEMGTPAGFRGYPPNQGYPFLREAIVAHEYRARDCEVDASEIFVSDGAKCDSAAIGEIFAADTRIAVTDPVYPVYVDANVMAGRTGPAASDGHYAGVCYLPCSEENGFVPEPPSEPVEVVYLCFPNNPTGTCATREQLERWVDWARESQAVLLFDAAYEAYISDPSIPHSIYEIPGAREVAIEFRSFSKSAGFTGIRCAWVVLPRSLRATSGDGRSLPLHDLWVRRHATRFNGVSYPVQVGAAAVYSVPGQKQVRERVEYYLRNAALVRESLTQAGLRVYGGRNAPYAWVRAPDGLGSWDAFDRLLTQAQVVVTPGAGFGPRGEGFFRVSAFGLREQVERAVERIAALQI
ncbi:MAG: LL-diaminopimelate aminotransferase [Myxococcota bacterium]